MSFLATSGNFLVNTSKYICYICFPRQRAIN